MLRKAINYLTLHNVISPEQALKIIGGELYALGAPYDFYLYPTIPKNCPFYAILPFEEIFEDHYHFNKFGLYKIPYENKWVLNASKPLVPLWENDIESYLNQDQKEMIRPVSFQTNKLIKTLTEANALNRPILFLLKNATHATLQKYTQTLKRSFPSLKCFFALLDQTEEVKGKWISYPQAWGKVLGEHIEPYLKGLSVPSPSPLPPIFPRTFDIALPWGERCQTTFNLEYFGLKGADCGFEWMLSTPRAVTDSFLNNFKNFTEKENFLFVHDNSLSGNYLGWTDYIMDRTYGLLLVHDFSREAIKLSPTIRNSLREKEFPTIKEKYNRRHTRLNERLEDAQASQKSILFYRHSNCTPQEATLISKSISIRFPSLDFTLLITGWNDEIKKDWGLPRVVNRWTDENDKRSNQQHPLIKKHFFDVVDFSFQHRAPISPHQKKTRIAFSPYQKFTALVLLGDDNALYPLLKELTPLPLYSLGTAISESPTTISFALMHNFENLFDKKNFMLIEDDLITKKNYNINSYYLDKRYFFRFFPSKPVSLEEVFKTNSSHFEEVKKAFDSALKENKPLLLIRKKSSKNQAELLSFAIKERYPSLKFTLLVVDSTEEIKQPWNIPYTINYFIANEAEISNVVRQLTRDRKSVV